MKKFSGIILLFVLFFTSCHKDDFYYTYPELDELLISVTRINAETEFRTEFNYDSLNRLVEVKNILSEDHVISEQYFYNEKDELVEKRIGNYTTAYSYDSEGKLVEQNIANISAEEGWEWHEKTEFQYRNGKINKGIVYSNDGEIVQYINYKYDSRGNTLEKTVTANAESDLNFIEIKFEYDTKVNPNVASRVNMLSGYMFAQYADIVQVNNPVYSSYLNLVSSSMPPEFEITYEYNSKNLPIKATMKNLAFPDREPIELVYEYQTIENN
ncbi:MAG TPA: hypothetical protein PK335_07100 [Draconibacterium sp.]|nr:hypothetical protein [Draconibacterium sp.]